MSPEAKRDVDKDEVDDEDYAFLGREFLTGCSGAPTSARPSGTSSSSRSVARCGCRASAAT